MAEVPRNAEPLKIHDPVPRVKSHPPGPDTGGPPQPRRPQNRPVACSSGRGQCLPLGPKTHIRAATIGFRHEAIPKTTVAAICGQPYPRESPKN